MWWSAAGPAGLEAARISAERGHHVVLFEAADDLGGQLRLAREASWRKDITGIIDWRRTELERLDVDVRLNHLADADDVRAEQPDVVIIASGGMPDLDWIDGAEHCTSVWDVLSGAVPVGEHVVVYDGTGRHPALTALDRCHAAGASVDLVLLDDRPATELAYAERVIWKRQLATLGVVPLAEHRLEKIERDGNRLSAHFVHELTGAPTILSADQVVVEHGTVPADEVYQELRAGSRNDGVTDIPALLAGKPQPLEAGSPDQGFALYRIGDAVSSRNVAAAMFDALRLCSVM